LFAFFFPGRLNDIELRCAATKSGATLNAYGYALYNANVIDREEVLKILESENRERNV